MNLKKFELDHLITLASNAMDNLSMNILDRIADELNNVDDNTPPEAEILEIKNTNENKYILSIWKNHSNAKIWHYDICPMAQYFKNSFNYLIEYKKPYYYTAIFTGSHDECRKMANEIKANYCDKENTEDL